ncbi:MAG: nucleotide-binding protein [Paracoccaceae bacterium]|nr:MAG: RNase adapter RapZ [Alphaproteobacteria bacterium]GIX12088.1 MAG: nucleotide-binding protein [Paracoccaceae bacterium]
MSAGRQAQRVVLVTGPSGAGRTTAIRALEDLRFEAIDNLPLSLLPRLLGGEESGRPLAVGFDVRTRGFSAAALIAALAELRAMPGVEPALLYLDCAEAVLIRRFSETRRRHPLSAAEGLEASLAAEIDLLRPVREAADILIDTTELSPHELKRALMHWFGGQGAQGMTVAVQSFSFRRGVPAALDLMFDVRFLRNPYWDPALRARDGRDPEVAAHIEADPRHGPFMERLGELILMLLPAYKEEGKAYLSIGIGCTGGRHRSVLVAESLARRLDLGGWPVSVRHRELERAGG